MNYLKLLNQIRPEKNLHLDGPSAFKIKHDLRTTIFI